MIKTNYNLKQLSDQLTRLEPYAPRVLVVLLAIYLLNYAAMMTWKLIPAPQQNDAIALNTPVSNSSSKGVAVNISKIKALDLFGKTSTQTTSKPIVTTTDAPETKLKLTLTGVVASTAETAGAAIVESRGQQNTYGIGDKIDGTSATVSEVYADRITIQNGGRMETLMLDGIDYNKQPTLLVGANDQPEMLENEQDQDSIQHRTLTPRVRDLRQEIAERPATFSEYISITPAINNGGPIGYRVNPGKSPELFNEAGLKSNDIITELNGLDLTDPQQAMEALSSLNEADSLQITVNRDGELLTLYLDLPSS
ncbi:type II secretion system protein GspC [Neptunicella marina]|uniref:Type II secretion system protein GspC n=1 Tax=Neptunicella marina TaxID=2125989 RepID=A0A8J6M1Y6_9ALTE|nr:type II secretion system protein GspC [Neptunicella marina]MBC3765862.1 type II secretion system protein GspC [Neptunicella marina]